MYDDAHNEYMVSEYGLLVRREISHLRSAIPCWLEALDNDLSYRFRRLLYAVWHDLFILVHASKRMIKKLKHLQRTILWQHAYSS